MILGKAEEKTLFNVGDFKMSDDNFLYDVKICNPSDLSRTEIDRCIDIISKGGAVTESFVSEFLPKAKMLAIARPCNENDIVGIGALKFVRPEYAEELAGKDKSNFSFDADTRELGFVAIDEKYRDRHISSTIVEQLCSVHKGSMFATTDSDKMKKTFKRLNFKQQGEEWEDRSVILSLWIRPSLAS